MNSNLKIARLEGEVLLLEEENMRLRQQLDWFADSQDRWRSRYLKEHPELDNWDSIEDMEPKP